MARHATLVAPRERRERLDDELVVLDLDELSTVDPDLDDEDRLPPFDAFATLPFGLGTVPRRVHAERATRTPLWLLALAALAMVAALAGNPSAPAPAPGAATRLLETPTGAHVAVVGYDRIVALDIDRRTSHVVRLAGLRDGDATSAAPAGTVFVAVIGGHAWAVSRLLDRPAIDLGPADAVFDAGAAAPGGAAPVWLARRGADGWEIEKADPATGRVVWEGRTAPDRSLVGATDDAVVVEDADGTVELVGGAGTATVHVRGAALGAANGVLATRACTGHRCAVQLIDLTSGHVRRIATPVGPGVHVGPAVFAPRGTSFASSSDGPAGPSTRVLVVRGGAARVVDTGGPATGLTWSGDWLFVHRADGQLVAVGRIGPAQLVETDPLPGGALVGLAPP